MNKITKIEVQKNNKNRVNIYIDEEYAFPCSAELIYTHKIKLNESIDVEHIKALVEEDNFLKAKNDGLKIIEKSYKTEKEVHDKLIRKGYELSTVERVVNFLNSYNFVDDKKYVNSYINDKISSMGRNKIYYTLGAKGVSEDIIEDKLNLIGEGEEIKGARKHALKKYKLLLNRESDPKKIASKLNTFLAGKGYSWEVIKAVVKDVLEGIEIDE
jgi:regulatory protein